jgi:hypothetical protein
MDNPETLAIQGTRHRTKTNKTKRHHQKIGVNLGSRKG